MKETTPEEAIRIVTAAILETSNLKELMGIYIKLFGEIGPLIQEQANDVQRLAFSFIGTLLMSLKETNSLDHEIILGVIESNVESILNAYSVIKKMSENERKEWLKNVRKSATMGTA